MTTDMISVIVPVYNAEPYLQRCLASILTQTYRNFELILVDDGSTDASGAICDEYAARDTRIRAVHKENGGVSKARNEGLLSAQGHYVTFVDADDMLEENALNNLFAPMLDLPTDLVIGGMKRRTQNLTTNVVSVSTYDSREDFVTEMDCFSETCEKLWAQNEMLSSCGKLYRLDIVRDNNLHFRHELIALEDAEFVFSYLDVIKTVRSISQDTYCVCDFVGRNSWMTRSRKDYTDDIRFVYQKARAFFDKHNVPANFQCRHTIDGQFFLALESLWGMASTKEEVRKKYKRLRQVLSWDEIHDVLPQRKNQCSKLEYHFAQKANVTGLRAIYKYRKFARKWI